MKERGLTIPEIMLIGGTRVALGVGLGLLTNDKFSRDARKGAGWALLAVGVLSTVPLVINVLGKPELPKNGLEIGFAGSRNKHGKTNEGTSSESQLARTVSHGGPLTVEVFASEFCAVVHVDEFVTAPLLADCTLLRRNVSPRNSKVELGLHFKKLVLIGSD